MWFVVYCGQHRSCVNVRFCFCFFFTLEFSFSLFRIVIIFMSVLTFCHLYVGGISKKEKERTNHKIFWRKKNRMKRHISCALPSLREHICSVTWLQGSEWWLMRNNLSTRSNPPPFFFKFFLLFFQSPFFLQWEATTWNYCTAFLFLQSGFLL